MREEDRIGSGREQPNFGLRRNRTEGTIRDAIMPLLARFSVYVPTFCVLGRRRRAESDMKRPIPLFRFSAGLKEGASRRVRFNLLGAATDWYLGSKLEPTN
jgi:hypothetical protein